MDRGSLTSYCTITHRTCGRPPWRWMPSIPGALHFRLSLTQGPMWCQPMLTPQGAYSPPSQVCRDMGTAH